MAFRQDVWSADPLPGDDFVNPLFNSVVLITFGIISVKLRLLACLTCCIAMVILLYSTWARNQALSTASWGTAPATAVTPDDVYQYLMLSLVIWVASIICAAFVMRWVLSLLKPATLKSALRQNWFPILFFSVAVFLRGWSEFLSFRAVSNDGGLVFHFMLAQVADTARAAIQAVLMSQTLKTSTKREKTAVTHMFVLSSFIVAQNMLNYGPWNIFSWIDIILQLHLMKKTSWAYVSFVDFIGAVLSLPFSLWFPPYNNDYVTEDLIESITPTVVLLSLLPSTKSHDLVEEPTDRIPDSVRLDGDQEPESIQHRRPSQTLYAIDVPLANLECLPQEEKSRPPLPELVLGTRPTSFLPELVPGTLPALQCLHSECSLMDSNRIE